MYNTTLLTGNDLLQSVQSVKTRTYNKQTTENFAYHPNQHTKVVRDIFTVANKSRKPPAELSPSSGDLGASNGSWGISFLLNRATSARILPALSTFPFTKSHLGDSGNSLCVRKYKVKFSSCLLNSRKSSF